MTGAVPVGVGRTALGVAMVRALESRRPDRLFCDPYAAAFIAAAPAVFDKRQRGAVAALGGLSATGSAFWQQAVVRTRFFDDYLLRSARRGLRQVVLLASGLDTRAYRLPWPAGVRLFEVDLAGVLDFKRDVLGRHRAVPRCSHRMIEADLRGDWVTPLAEAGLRPGEPTCWLAEGLLIYLSGNEVIRLLDDADVVSAADSRMAFESGGDASILREQAQRVPGIGDYAALWQGGLEDTPGWLRTRGWLVEEHDWAGVTTRYGRATTGTYGGFVTATRA